METKTCTKCGRELPIENFSTRKDTGKPHSNCKECIIAYRKEYREKNKDVISSKYKQWREANHEKHIEYCKNYYQENKDRMLDRNKKYYNENKEELQAKNREYWNAHKDELNIKQRERWSVKGGQYNETHKKWYEKNRASVLLHNKQWRETNHVSNMESKKKYVERNRVAYDEYHRNYRLNNRDDIKVRQSEWLKTEAGKLSSTRHKQKRRLLGFNPINDKFEGSEFHHLHIDGDCNKDNSIGLFIPAELHKSIPHNHDNWKGMDEMNEAAVIWYEKFVSDEVMNVCHELTKFC